MNKTPPSSQTRVGYGLCRSQHLPSGCIWLTALIDRSEKAVAADDMPNRSRRQFEAEFSAPRFIGLEKCGAAMRAQTQRGYPAHEGTSVVAASSASSLDSLQQFQLSTQGEVRVAHIPQSRLGSALDEEGSRHVAMLGGLGWPFGAASDRHRMRRRARDSTRQPLLPR